jgi:hypothetical protein
MQNSPMAWEIVLLILEVPGAGPPSIEVMLPFHYSGMIKQRVHGPKPRHHHGRITPAQFYAHTGSWLLRAGIKLDQNALHCSIGLLSAHFHTVPR